MQSGEEKMEGKEQSNKMKLSEYLDGQRGASYYPLFGERLLAASELFGFLTDPEEKEVAESAAKIDFDLDAFLLEEIKDYDGDADGFKHYSVSFDESRKEIAESGQAKKAEEVAFHLACALFRICFCHHPLKGRAYYESLSRSEETDRKFFADHPRFIFDLDDNPNRFINGYHEITYEIWICLNEAQQAFWKDAFGRKIDNLEALKARWDAAYSFRTIISRTPCGEKYPSLFFDEKTILIPTENMISNQSVYCRYGKSAMEIKCEACTVEMKRTSYLKIPLTVECAAEGEEKTPKKIIAFDKKTIYVKDILDSEEEKEAFCVIESQKAAVLGLKNLTDRAIDCTCGSEEKTYEKGKVIPMLPGMRIAFDETHTLIVPGTPAKAKKAAPEPEKKTASIDQAANPTPEPSPAPIVQTPIDAVVPPTQAPLTRSSTSIDQSLVKQQTPQPKPTQPSIQTTPATQQNQSAHVFKPRAGSVLTRSNYSFSMESFGGDELNGCTEYQVRHKSDSIYDLFVFEKNVSDQKGFTDNIKALTNMSKTERTLFDLIKDYAMLPFDLIQESFFEGRFAYVAPTAQNTISLDAILSGSPFKGKEIVRGFYQLFKVLDILHQRGYCMRVLSKDNIGVDMTSKKMFFRGVHYLSKENGELPQLPPVYTPDEVLIGYCLPDGNSDCYALAVLFFQILFKLKRFDRKKILAKGADGVRDWREGLPPEIVKLFVDTFSVGTESDDLTEEEKAELLTKRDSRPTAKNWCDVLMKYSKSGN